MLSLDPEIVRLADDRASAELQVRTFLKRNDRLVVDVYHLHAARHPEDHCGWWLFHLDRRLEGTLYFDFSQIGPHSVTLRTNDQQMTAADCWFNPEFTFSPVQDLYLVLRDRNNRAVARQIYQLTNSKSGVLKRFYDNLHSTAGYKTEGNTFLNTLHQFKLRKLSSIFSSFINASDTVLDVGCGNSLFTEIKPQWDFTLFCCDIGEPVIRQRTELFPCYHWLVSDVESIPFPNRSFDALFAGEIIEHMSSVNKTLSEWRRVLKDNGVLIMTTPNRDRLKNRINHSRRPMGEDHLNELSFDDINQELTKAGFSIIHSESFYIELFLNWWSRGEKFDYLQSIANKPTNTQWMNLLNRIGGFFPRLAFGLIFVARKNV